MLMLSMLIPTICFAAALGDELILSQLGDPVEVEIAVLQWEDIELDQLQISAGTPQVYESFGLDYLPALESLNFNLIGPNLDGEVKILVSSREPMSEPYLELLLVLRWPGGSLLREYVLLFDPPRSSAPATTASSTTPQVAVPAERVITPAPAIAAEPPAPGISEPEVAVPDQNPESQEAIPEAQPPALQTAEIQIADEPAPVVEVSDTEVDEVAVLQEEIPAVTTSSVAIAATTPATLTYTVDSGDTLWDIATEYGPVGANANLYQILLSLYELNREAFINGNISLLKYGVTLQLPTAADVTAINPETAQSLFDQRWNEGSERIDMAERGESLPPLSSLFEPVVARPEINPTAGLEIAPGQPPAQVNTGGLVIASSDTPVAAPASAPGQNQVSDPGLVVSPVQTANSPTTPLTPALSPTIDPLPAIAAAEIDTVNATSNNPYLDQLNTTAQFIQQMLAARQQQVALLEAQMAEMSTRMLEITQVTERLNTSLDEALAERERQQQSFRRDTFLLGGLVLVLSAALIAVIVLVLKLASQIRVQHELLQRSMKGQPHVATKASGFTERAVQPTDLASSSKTPKVQKTVQQALAVSIIDDEEEETDPGVQQSGMQKELNRIPETIMAKEELNVSLGDMEIEHPDDENTANSR